jgi:ATP/maltotriose-dependent transcriptional regulator MalT
MIRAQSRALPATDEGTAVTTSILRTKLYAPPVRPELVSRRRLVEQLDAGMLSGSRLMLISVPAGFGTPALHRRCK